MNKLYLADNLDLMKSLLKQHPQGFIDLVYIDPPFNSKRNYNIIFKDLSEDKKAHREVFKDTWSNINYIDILEELNLINEQCYKFIKSLEFIDPQDNKIPYLSYIAIRLYYIRQLLKDTGSFYLHCDPTMSHYLKILSDFIFGSNNFRNEIAWGYRTGGATKKGFSKKT